MVALASFAAGDKPTAAQLNTLPPKFARRLSDSSAIVSNTTLANDDTLVVTPSVSVAYKVSFGVIYRSSATADLKVALTWPTGASCFWGGIGLTAADSLVMQLVENSASGTHVTLGGGGTGTSRCCWFEGILVMSSTAGNLQAQFAQSSTDATNTVIRAGSWLMIEQVE